MAPPDDQRHHDQELPQRIDLPLQRHCTLNRHNGVVMIGLVAIYPASIWALIQPTGTAGAIAWLCRTMSRPA